MLKILTEYSPWYILICVVVGLAYAILLYTKKVPWGKNFNFFLSGTRFLLVTAICFLLLGPYIKQIQNYFEKPIVVFAIDDSQSIPLVTDSVQIQTTLGQLNDLANALAEEEYEIDLQTINSDQSLESFTNIQFDGARTNLNDRLKGIQSQYENRNIAGVVLLSDGIYNQGVSPLYTSYNTKVFTMGIGDTLPQVDLNLKTAYANKIAYLGNKFPIVVDVVNAGFVGKTTEVVLYQKGKAIDRKSVTFDRDEGLQTVDFLASSDKEGMQHFTIQVQPIVGEFTTQNNTKNVYIDILNSKEKILMVAAAPHPDIKAFKSAVEKNQNYEFTTHVPSLARELEAQEILKEKYDLVIFHQIPNRNRAGNDLLQKFLEKQVAKMFVLGTQSSIRNFNRLNQIAQIQASGLSIDKVTPYYNSRFDKFTFDNDKKSVIGKFPPALVPFGDYNLLGNSETVLFQKVGTISTEKPLLIVNEQEGIKNALLLGEGVWQWRLQEYSLNQNHEAFDEMITKLVQYLSTKEDKRRFRVYPTSNEYFSSEAVYFETEVYNEIYEKVYGQKVDLKITNEQGETQEYVYVNNGANFKYAVNGLTQGIYKYRASTVMNGEPQFSTGEFTIKKLEIEAISTTANFNLLRNLAQQTDGQFYTTSQIEDLKTELIGNKTPDIIHTQEEFEEIINMEWIFAILILLASLEWFFRKYKGSY